MAHSAHDVAKAILALSNPEIGDIVSNLKLQKLLYYTQGFSLAILNEPIFEEDIVAWEYGPVVINVYHEYKTHGGNGIIPDEDFDSSIFSSEELDVIKEVYEVYGQFSALRLMNMTHEESPWRDAVRNSPISKKKMKRFFKDLIEEE